MNLPEQTSFLKCYSSLINLYAIFAQDFYLMDFSKIVNRLITQSFQLIGIAVIPMLVLFLNPNQLPSKKAFNNCVFSEMSFDFIEADSFSFNKNESDNVNHYYVIENQNLSAYLILSKNQIFRLTNQTIIKEFLDSGIFIPPPEIL